MLRQAGKYGTSSLDALLPWALLPMLLLGRAREMAGPAQHIQVMGRRHLLLL